MLTNFSNQVQIAVDRVGGPTKTAHAMEVSNATIHEWIKNKRVPDIDMAKKLATLAAMSHELLRRTR